MESVAKSYRTNDPVKDYCIKHSSPLHPVQLRLLEVSIFINNLIMLIDIINTVNFIILILRRHYHTAGAG